MPTKTSSTSKPLTAPRSRKQSAAGAVSAPATTTTGDAALAPPAVAAAVPTTPNQPSKSAIALKLLSRAKGATIAEVAEPTGWQPHSTRAYLSGLRKKGLTVVREQRKTGETTYRIVDAASAKVDTAVPLATDTLTPAMSDGAAPGDADGDMNGAAAPIDAGLDSSPDAPAAPGAAA